MTKRRKWEKADGQRPIRNMLELRKALTRKPGEISAKFFLRPQEHVYEPPDRNRPLAVELGRTTKHNEDVELCGVNERTYDILVKIPGRCRILYIGKIVSEGTQHPHWLLGQYPVHVEIGRMTRYEPKPMQMSGQTKPMHMLGHTEMCACCTISVIMTVECLRQFMKVLFRSEYELWKASHTHITIDGTEFLLLRDIDTFPHTDKLVVELKSPDNSSHYAILSDQVNTLIAEKQIRTHPHRIREVNPGPRSARIGNCELYLDVSLLDGPPLM